MTTRFLQTLLQRGLTTKRRCPSTGSHLLAVLSYHRQIHHTSMNQNCHILRQQIVQHSRMLNTKISQRVVIDAHTTTQPHVCHMLGAQTIKRSRTTNTL
jgi:hypothetical protein